MKKLLFLLLTVSLSTVFAKSGHKSLENLSEINQIILLTDITPAISKELLAGRLPTTAVECRENMSLPVAYFMKAPFFSLECLPNLTVKIQKTCYVRFTEKRRGYLSGDLKSWEKIEPMLSTLYDTTVGISADKAHLIVETSENPDFQLRKKK